VKAALSNPRTRYGVVALLGLASMGYGLWLLVPAAAFLVVGASIFALAVLELR